MLCIEHIPVAFAFYWSVLLAVVFLEACNLFIFWEEG